MMMSDASATAGVHLTPGLVGRVWRFAHAYRSRVFAFLGLVVVQSFLGLVPPLVIKQIIDHVVRQAAARLGRQVGQFGHAQAVVGRLGQGDEHAVVVAAQPVGLERVVEGGEQVAGAVDDALPGVELDGREPVDGGGTRYGGAVGAVGGGGHVGQSRRNS